MVRYRREGIRRSVEAVILVHNHNHPHVLLLQLGSAFFKLPGGRLRPGEDGMVCLASLALQSYHGSSIPLLLIASQILAFIRSQGMALLTLHGASAERDGLRRKLTTQLSPEAASLAFSWDIADTVGMYWRPNFDVSMYPYLPAHITRPKEVKKIFLVPLPEKCYLAVSALLARLRLAAHVGPNHDFALPGTFCCMLLEEVHSVVTLTCKIHIC